MEVWRPNTLVFIQSNRMSTRFLNDTCLVGKKRFKTNPLFAISLFLSLFAMWKDENLRKCGARLCVRVKSTSCAFLLPARKFFSKIFVVMSRGRR